MVHQLEPSRSTLPPVEDWRTQDSRRLRYVVAMDVEDTPMDLTNVDVSWALLGKPYHQRADAILTDEDSGVTLQREGVVDPTKGEFRVDVTEDTITEWGSLWQRVSVDPADDSRQTWLGRVTVTARGTTVGDTV